MGSLRDTKLELPRVIFVHSLYHGNMCTQTIFAKPILISIFNPNTAVALHLCTQLYLPTILLQPYYFF